MTSSEFFGQERISKILFKLAPPVMLSQLIQALYNIVDSFFIGHNSSSGLTALSIIYPMQLFMIALAVGSGVGINTAMAAKFGRGRKEEALKYAGMAFPLAFLLWLLFAFFGFILMPSYASLFTRSKEIFTDVVTYGRICCLFSFGLFFESGWTKVIQAEGNMRLPMIAQITGALVNLALDPFLIFGLGPFPHLGIAGAAYATVTGQIIAALIVMKKGYRKSPSVKFYGAYSAGIFKLGVPNMIMQSAYTFYIFGLNLILESFSDEAVTALGIYYKWQSFFFIPLGAMQTCVVPLLSFNYGAGNIDRCKRTVRDSVFFGMILMFIGTLCFEFLPSPMFHFFTDDLKVIKIGVWAFRFIGVSFIPMSASLMFPVVFQALARPIRSSLITIIRTVLLFVPLGYLFSRFGLAYFWLTFPVTETLTTLAGFFMYKKIPPSAISYC
ncbi:MAG: MATE family efflux transporter [Treponema sp.]|nr:MATE family efflux transporter [Treponema sp.]